MKDLTEAMMLTKLAPLFVVQDGGAAVPRTVDFLATRGLLPVQGCVEEWWRDSPAERAA